MFIIRDLVSFSSYETLSFQRDEEEELIEIFSQEGASSGRFSGPLAIIPSTKAFISELQYPAIIS